MSAPALDRRGEAQRLALQCIGELGVGLGILLEQHGDSDTLGNLASVVAVLDQLAPVAYGPPEKVACLTFAVAPSMWLSSNRMPTNPAHLSRVRKDLHRLAGGMARLNRVRAIPTPCTASWVVQYPHGTGEADASNAQPTTKALLDGLVKAGHLTNDDSRHVLRESFERGENLAARADRAAVHRITLTIGA